MSNPETTGIPLTSPDNSLLHPPVHNETASNAALQPDPSTLPITPSVLPYEANVPSDPNLWDGHFGPISLFSMNEFLQSDACNISCSLLCMAEFIRQRNISNCNSNKIPQIDSFGEATFKFILASHEAGWDRLNTLDKTPLRNKIKLQFVDTAPSNHCYQDTGKNLVAKIPPPLPTCLPCKQLEEVEKHMEQRQKNKKNLTNKSYAQAISLVVDILKLRDAFPALPNKKIIELHNAVLSKPAQKGKKKYNTSLKVHPGNRLLFLSLPNTLLQS